MNKTEELIQKHFEKKPGENIQVLKDRYERISEFHKDPLSAALLATSFYGMEELQMRLPRLNDILRNPFSREEILHAITGLIMIADGGPAEGAKAIQIYMALQKKGLQELDTKTSHMLALLAICCRQVNPLMTEIFPFSDYDRERFCQAAEDWLLTERERQEDSLDVTNIAFSLLVGMKEEVETILDEEL